MTKNMEAYLDNAATTRPYPSVIEQIRKTMEEDYANPSSLHRKGLEAERYIKEARKTIADTLKAEEKEIIFTSGGTESNNLALIGAAMACHRRGKHIITTAVEHPSVSRPLQFLEEQGFCVSYLPVDSNGRVDLNKLLDEIRPDTILVSVMYVNNEVGTVEPIEEIGRAIKEKNKDTIFHVDGIQAYGKFLIPVKSLGIDLLSASGHKIHGPKGIGFLYVKDKVKIKPVIFGGQQQRGLRSGTENVPGIAGLSMAVNEAFKDYGKNQEKLYNMKEYFIDGLRNLDGVYVNGLNHIPVRQTAPHIISASFEKIKSEVLLHALEEKNIFVSSGSACSSNHPGLSGTLRAIGLKKDLLDSTIRFSLSAETTIDELDYTLEVLKNVIPLLRKYTRR